MLSEYRETIKMLLSQYQNLVLLSHMDILIMHRWILQLIGKISKAPPVDPDSSNVNWLRLASGLRLCKGPRRYLDS